LAKQTEQPVAGPHKERTAAKGDRWSRSCPRQCCLGPVPAQWCVLRRRSNRSKAPAASKTARLVDFLDRELPVIDPDPPGITRFGWWRADDFVHPCTMAKGAPMFRPCSAPPNLRRTRRVKRKLTAGRPFWSKAGAAASTSCSPVTNGGGFDNIESGRARRHQAKQELPRPGAAFFIRAAVDHRLKVSCAVVR